MTFRICFRIYCLYKSFEFRLISQKHKMNDEKKPEKIKISRLSKEAIESELLYGVILKIYERNGVFTANFARKVNQLKSREAFKIDAGKFNFKDIEEIVDHFAIEITFWFLPKYSRHKGKKRKIMLPVKIKSFHPNSDPLLSANFILSKKDAEISLQTTDLSIVVNESKFFEYLSLPRSFFSCLSMKLEIDEDEIKEKWEKPVIRFHDERLFFKIFGIGFTIWRLKSVLKEDVNNVEHEIVYQSAYDNHLLVQSLSDDWNFEKTDITSEDRFCLADETNFEVFRCPNDFCSYLDRKKSNFIRHVKNCTNETKYKFAQVDKKEGPISDWLIAQKFLKTKPNPKEFISFDIETSGKASDRIISEHTQIKSAFRIASISVTKSSGESKVFIRESSSEYDYIKIVSDFFTFLIKYRDEYRQNLPDEINNAFFKVKEILFRKKTDPQYVRLPPIYHGKLRRAYNYLNKVREAKIVGFNSESFDLPVLVPAFMKAWSSKYFRNLNKGEKIPREPKPHVIKRGSGFLTLGFLGCRFYDFHNFFTSGSLATAGKVFGVSDPKLMFPYEKYESVEDMAADLTFPPYSDFKTSLSLSNDSTNISEKLYEAFIAYETKTGSTMPNSLRDFESVMKINDFVDVIINDDRPRFIVPDANNHLFFYCPIKYIDNLFLFEDLKNEGQISSMKDYLGYYNKADTILTMQAFKKMLHSFDEQFSVNLLDFYSMPSVAGHLLWRKFDNTVASPFSLQQKYNFLGHRFRKACDGGLASPKHRHIATGNQANLYPDCVGKTPNGEYMKLAMGLDFNSLYPHSKTLDLPCGAGYFYERKSSGKFQWSAMKNKSINWSVISIEWLNYQNSLTPFCDGDKIHHISHALNHNEVMIKMDDIISYPDGYCRIGDVQYFLYYQGCRFHYHEGCPISKAANILDGKKQKDDKVRAWCRRNGVYIEIFDCEWRRLRKKVQYKNLSSCFYNRQSLISEQEILNRIEDGSFFGCIEIDVTSPPETIKHFQKLDWPPVYRKVEVDASMVQPKLLENITKFKPTKQLTQTYHGESMLLTTDMFLFYKSKGMQFKNMKFAVEYQRGKPMKNFVDELVNCRIAADQAKQPALVALYKLLLNSAYGYLLINKSKVSLSILFCLSHILFQQRDVTYRKIKNNQIIEGPFVQSALPMEGEYPSDFYEVISRKRRITDTIPSK